MENTQEYKGYTIKIEQDELAESPREWDNLGKMVCFHPRYNLGDFDSNERKAWDNPQDFYESLPKNYIILPLYLMDHSGLSIRTSSFNDRFDSGQVGYIYADTESILKEFSCKRVTNQIRQRVIRILENEVKTYDTYLQGGVCWYKVENSEGEEIDSCGGWYSEDEALEEAKRTIDYAITKAPKARDKSILGRMHV